MIDWLVRTFIPQSEDTGDPKVRTTYGTLASIVSIICNIVLCVGKGVVGLMVGSVSIVADAVNNLTDASSNIISFLGFKMASRPADEDHPYGHGRSEYLAGLVVAAMVMAIGVELIRSSADKIMNPTPAEFSGVVVVVLLASIAVKFWMAHLNSTLGKKISSTALEATAADSRNDVIATASVLVAAVVSRLTDVDLDGWVGLAVGAFIVWSGFGLLQETIDPLLGKSPDPAFVEHIRSKIMSYPGVLGTHDLMVHDYGPGRQFASAHVEMAAEVDPMESHDTIDIIEHDFLANEGLHIVLHYDPIVTDDPEVANLRNWIAQQVLIIHPKLTIHDLRTVPGPTHTNVIFDCVKPHDLKMSDDELRGTISGIVRATYPSYFCVITVDQSYLSAE